MSRFAFTLAWLALAPCANAATFLVDTTSDDGSAPFQLCDANPGNANCSFRGAITLANASAGADSIVFDIPISDSGYVAATDHWRISPATTLPLIQDTLSVDGYSQPGATANTLAADEGGSNAVLKIELHGFGSSSQAGIDVGNGNPLLHLRGVAINNFQINVQLQSPGPNVVEGCFIGTDITGMQGMAASNNSYGIRQRGAAIIGGTTPAVRNVISGNGYIGLWDESANSTFQTSQVQGNIIGLGADGSTVLQGQDYGLYVTNPVQGNVIGGGSVAARNLVSGIETSAIYISTNAAAANANPVRIQGNVFGTDWSGTLARPNGSFPSSPSQPQPTIVVFRGGECGVLIGGDAAGEGNRIAHGAAAGVLVSTCTGAAILGNSFHGNAIGIDLAPFSNADGATPNDAGDVDQGGNRLQNTPHIESISYLDNGATMQIDYLVDSATGNSAYPLRVDIGGGSKGQMEIIAFTDSIAEVDAQTLRSVSLSTASLGGHALVLLATDADGNTSEFTSDALFDDDFEE